MDELRLNYNSYGGIDRRNPSRHCNIYIRLLAHARLHSTRTHSRLTRAYTAKQCMHIHTVR